MDIFDFCNEPKDEPREPLGVGGLGMRKESPAKATLLMRISDFHRVFPWIFKWISRRWKWNV